MTVPIEELFDSNIAQFNRAGDLTGGLLFSAKEAGVKIPGRVLADMVQDSPINRIKIRELGIPQTVINKTENIVKTQNNKPLTISNSKHLLPSLIHLFPTKQNTTPFSRPYPFTPIHYIDNTKKKTHPLSLRASRSHFSH